MTNFIVSLINYEYNDEGYDRTDGGNPEAIFTNRSDAQDYINQNMIKSAKDGSFEVFGGKELRGTTLEEYLSHFGEYGLSLGEYNGVKYASLEYELDLSEWTDESIVKFIEILGLELYYITELEN